MLRNLAYRSISENPSASPRTLSVFVTDGDGGKSSTVTKTINVVRVNDAPVLGGIGGTVGYTNASPPIVLDSNATVTDADSANFNGGKLTVRVSDGGHSSNRIELGGTLFIINANNQVIRKDAVNGNKVIGTLNANGGVGLTKFRSHLQRQRHGGIRAAIGPRPPLPHHQQRQRRQPRVVVHADRRRWRNQRHAHEDGQCFLVATKRSHPHR